MSRITFLGLGSNLGSPKHNVERAIAGIGESRGLELIAYSSLYHSKAIGPKQPDYVNAVVKVSTALPPLVLLYRLQSLERQLGRISCERWNARIIDIDILQMQGVTLCSEALTIPHPSMQQRPFVMEPLRELEQALPVAREA